MKTITLFILALMLASCRGEKETICYVVKSKQMVYASSGYPNYWVWVEKDGNIYEKKVTDHTYFKCIPNESICFEEYPESAINYGNITESKRTSNFK
jgi:hypothetical protein